MRLCKTSVLFIHILAILLACCACNLSEPGSVISSVATETVVQEDINETTDAKNERSTPFENYIYRYEDNQDHSWEEDIVYLARTFLENHPLICDTYYFEMRNYEANAASYLVNDNEFYDEVLRNTFINEINLLLAAIPEMEDMEIQYKLRRIVALLGDAHSTVTTDITEFFPLTVSALESEEEFAYYTVRIPIEHDSLLYSRLISINGIPLEEVIDLLSPYVSSENVYWEDYCIFDNFWNSLFIQKELLQAAGVVADNSDTAEFAFITEDGSVATVTLEAISGQEYSSENMARDDFYAKRITMWEHPDKNYWYKFYPNENALYARISTCSEIGGYAFQTYCGEILDTLRTAEGSLKLIIDLRGNTGGSYPMSGFEDFVAALAKLTQHEVYILIDNGVFSSGLGMAAKLSETLPNAVMVGTPAGQPINMWGNPKYYTMPNSQLRFRVSEQYWKFAETMEADALVPNIIIYQTLEDQKNGVDTVLEYVKALDE